MSRMRTGEWLAGIGAVGLFVTLFFDWFGVSFKSPKSSGLGAVNLVGVQAHTSLSGWSTLGWFMDVLLCVAILGGLAVTYMTAMRAAPAWPVGAAVLTWAGGAVIFLILVVRVLSLAGDEGSVAIGVQLPAYLGLLFTLLIPVGAFLSLRDERTDSADARAYTPPTPRTAP